MLVSARKPQRSLCLEGALQLDGPFGVVDLSACPGRVSLDLPGPLGPVRALRALLLARRMRRGLHFFLNLTDADLKVTIRGVEVASVRDTCSPEGEGKPQVETNWSNLLKVLTGLL